MDSNEAGLLSFCWLRCLVQSKVNPTLDHLPAFAADLKLILSKARVSLLISYFNYEIQDEI
jgi:hypothetical protein